VFDTDTFLRSPDTLSRETAASYDIQTHEVKGRTPLGLELHAFRRPIVTT